MEKVSPRWAATIEFGVSDGKAWAGGRLSPAKASDRGAPEIHRPGRDGRAVARPYMLARLNPGAYDVNVTLGGLTPTRSRWW